MPRYNGQQHEGDCRILNGSRLGKSSGCYPACYSSPVYVLVAPKSGALRYFAWYVPCQRWPSSNLIVRAADEILHAPPRISVQMLFELQAELGRRRTKSA